MRKLLGLSLDYAKLRAKILSAIFAAAVVGGASGAVVLASIPDTGGTIHGCYSNSKGTLTVIDTSVSTTCPSNTTPLNWSQGSSSTGSSSSPLYDANGQLLGNIIAYGNGGQSISVFNATLQRLIDINFFSSNSTAYYTVGLTGFGPNFASTDCTGQPYIHDGSFIPNAGGGNDAGIKTKLLRLNSTSYGIVPVSSVAQSVTLNSSLAYDTSTDTFNCINTGPFTDSSYAINQVTLPFSLPLLIPFKF